MRYWLSLDFIQIMQQPLDFYTAALHRYTTASDTLQRRLKLLSISRLFAFVSTVLILYFLRNDISWAIPAALLGMTLFLFLIRYYEDVKIKYRILHALAKINATEIAVLQHEFSELDQGKQYSDPEHEYSHDLDLFGQGSFFQYMNRTQLPEGKDLLAQLLKENAATDIVEKQHLIQELAGKPKWRQQFTAHASLITHEVAIAEVIHWLQHYTPFVPKGMRYLPWIFLGIFIGLAALVYGQVVSEVLLLFWGVLGLGITGRYFKQISHLALKADRIKATFKQYSQLIHILEETQFKAPALEAQKQRLLLESKTASVAIQKFSSLLNTMDYNNNIFYAIFGNGCFLGALQTAFQIERWIQQYNTQVGEWFKVIAFFDAATSLGNFAFNHPQYSFPKITDDTFVLSCKKVGHPLIPSKGNIRNDFTIRDENFFIITGSNMAGKSTFLRTVGLSVIMANMGLPICAEECIYSPIKLVTSMRSVDSLYKGDSYFLSELKRLKKVVLYLEQERYFVLLDEILKGTNSTDKAQGSKRFVERLLRVKATGLIATHDLSLCEVATTRKNVHNYHLDATIKEDTLYFDYLLKKGVSQTMNASFLLEKMDLV